MKISKVIMLFFIIPITLNIMTTNAIIKQPLHGYINNPPSRAFLCSLTGGKLNINSGAVQYEDQSIEGVKGFPFTGSINGHIASVDNIQFYEFDQKNMTR